MGLLSIIRKIKRKEKEMRVLMVGLDNSGKTTIVLKINGEDTSVISPTLGFNIKTIKYHKYFLNIWDVGGQKTIRSYWRNYFEQTDGLVWVVDSSDIRRLDDCRAELHNLLKEERLAGASLLVFANKQDIQGALKPAEIAKVDIAAQSLSSIPVSKRGEYLVKKRLGEAIPLEDKADFEARLVRYDLVFGQDPENMEPLNKLFVEDREVGARKRRRRC